MILRNIKNSFNSFLKVPKIYQTLLTMSSSSEVIFKEHGDKGIVILNRPKALNALNSSMIHLIYPKVKEWESSKKLVIIKGEGEKAFCAGGDVLSITEAGKRGEPLTKTFFKEEYFLNSLIGHYRIPYIALLDGITMGGGVGISVHGKYRVATEKSLFAMPETGIGLFPDVGGSFFLPKLKGQLGMFLGLTGYRLKGRDVLYSGIATHACDSNSLADLETSLLDCETDDCIRKILDKFSSNSKFGTDQNFSLEPHMPQIDKCFAGDSVEQIVENLERDGSEWARKQVKIISKMSPTSLKITHELLRRGRQKTLNQCLVEEYRLTQRCCSDHDFYEGVRAVLVDKDNSPQWKPNSLSNVSEDIVERYFSPLPPEDELVF